ncbi:alpha-E domain-containing protein [Falsiroseomonas selenitidurans]|uniref:Alpha-E domain-containing protein n=1 Tax=Falsiroseomonas selenitidurans TaxID=2716335 RepID=A0ABX1E0A0_9PROT|nr:alpha-E domain-containing protein [Falsiroseomonas selenitidurans]NKC30574.1 alpha-E domain-containing protein [Falsiroseomonas selenitidurans]
MLSRTADSLFWMGRYTERAGNLARGMQVALRMSGLGSSLGGPEEGLLNEWHSLLVAAGAEPGYREHHAAVTAEAVIRWLALDARNPSSIAACIEAARGNGRAVRTALTVDMWEALNDTWREMRLLAPTAADADRLPGFLDWVRARAHLFNGAAADTMLRDEGWLFVHLGVMLERADNTARLLDSKHDALAGPGSEGAVAYAQWQALLRSVSALRSFQWLYHTRLRPGLVAEMLVVRPELPRSLVSCHGRVLHALEGIAEATGGRRGDPQRIAAEIQDRLAKGRMEDILARGLHDWLTAQINRNIELGRAIQALYLSG